MQAGGQHKGVAADLLAVAGDQGFHAAALQAEAAALGALHAAEIGMAAQALGQLQAQGMAVGHGLAGGEDAAGKAAVGQGQGGLQGQAFAMVQDLLGTAGGGAQALGQTGELLGLAVDHQLAGRAQGDGVQAGVLLHAGEGLLAEGTQGQQPLGAAAVHRAAAGAQKGQHPGPLVPAQLGLEAQRAVRVQQPAQGLERHAGIGQGRDIAVAELAAIGTAGALGQGGLALHQRDLVPFLGQGPGSGQTDHPTPDHHNLLHPVPWAWLGPAG